MRALSADEKIQAALLVDSWECHSKAIATVAKAGAYDDLRMRYPLPWREDFEGQSNVACISCSWAYAIDAGNRSGNSQRSTAAVVWNCDVNKFGKQYSTRNPLLRQDVQAFWQ